MRTQSKRGRSTAIAMGLAAACAVVLAGCGGYSEAHDYNAPTPSANVTPQWTRIETPYHYNTIIRACVGKDGVYIDLANDNSPDVVPGDPACAAGAKS